MKQTPFDNHEEIAEQLSKIGWSNPCDAQWDKLKKWCEGMRDKWPQEVEAKDRLVPLEQERVSQYIANKRYVCIEFGREIAKLVCEKFGTPSPAVASVENLKETMKTHGGDVIDDYLLNEFAQAIHNLAHRRREMKSIAFSHVYKKLLDEHNDLIEYATLINVINIDLENMPSCFIDYDTDDGEFKLPPKGKYLMLMFLKPHEEWVESRDLFTTLRRQTPEKEQYYRAAIGERFDIKMIETDRSPQ